MDVTNFSICSSLTSRLRHANLILRRNFSRSNCSTLPLFLRINKSRIWTRSTVVNFAPHWLHTRRRRIIASSISGRESVTRLSVELQYGHLIPNRVAIKNDAVKQKSHSENFSKNVHFYKNQDIFSWRPAGRNFFSGPKYGKIHVSESRDFNPRPTAER